MLKLSCPTVTHPKLVRAPFVKQIHGVIDQLPHPYHPHFHQKHQCPRQCHHHWDHNMYNAMMVQHNDGVRGYLEGYVTQPWILLQWILFGEKILDWDCKVTFCPFGTSSYFPTCRVKVFCERC